MTTWKGQEFEREWHRAMLEWIDGGRVGGHPAWQLSVNEGAWIDSHPEGEPYSYANLNFRWAPKPKRTVTINGKTLVAPEAEAPAKGTEYYTMASDSVPFGVVWDCDFSANARLTAANVFLTREDAQAMADWLVKCRRGET